MADETPDSFGLPRPQIDPSAWIAPGAVVVGRVSLGAEASIWFNAVIRGDSDEITIGARTNIQDGCVLHADPGFPCRIGADVTVGHNAIVHGATIEDRCLIGMGAIVLNGALIETGSIVGAGAVVTEGLHVPAGSLVLGVPGKVIRQLTPAEAERIGQAATSYIAKLKQYKTFGAAET